jgi:transcriptional regulator with XRE-family HTH domain
MEESGRKVFAQRLRYAREELRKITQSQLGEAAGLPATSISHFENEEGTRKPSFDNFRSLAKALDVTTDYLLGRVDEPHGIALDEKLYRDVKSLTEADKQFAEDIIQRLAERNRPKG